MDGRRRRETRERECACVSWLAKGWLERLTLGMTLIYELVPPFLFFLNFLIGVQSKKRQTEVNLGGLVSVVNHLCNSTDVIKS